MTITLSYYKWYAERFFFNLISSFPLPTTLVTIILYTHFAPPHCCTMLTKHFHLTQVCILPFSKIEKGNGGAETYSVSHYYGCNFMFLAFSIYPTTCLCVVAPSDVLLAFVPLLV